MNYVDTKNLDLTRYIHKQFLEAVNLGQDSCFIDAVNWENEPDKFPDDDFDLPWLETKPNQIDAAIILTISFE
jgi:hypothetical protein